MPRQTLGTPSITGSSLEEVRQQAQFWLQRVYDELDKMAGVRGTPTFYGDLDINGRRLTNLGAPSDPADAVPEGFALTKVTDPITGTAQWNAENLQILNVQAANALDQGVNLSQMRQEIAEAGLGLIPAGCILMWSGSIATIPVGWRLCDGTSGTPDLRDRFVIGAGSTYAVAATGGAATINLAHTHTADGTLAAASAGSHTHADGTLAAASDGAHTHNDGTLGTGAPSATTTVDNTLGGSTAAVASDTHTHDVTGATASGGAHTHDVTGDTASDGAHTHDVTGDTSSALSATQNVLNPFYSLCFIMKV